MLSLHGIKMQGRKSWWVFSYFNSETIIPSLGFTVFLELDKNKSLWAILGIADIYFRCCRNTSIFFDDESGIKSVFSYRQYWIEPWRPFASPDLFWTEILLIFHQEFDIQFFFFGIPCFVTFRIISILFWWNLRNK